MNTQCKSHDEEIKALRKKSHVVTNRLVTLELRHEENRDDIKEIKDDIGVIKTNHLSHIEADINVMKTEISWIKKLQWLGITTSIGVLVVVLVDKFV